MIRRLATTAGGFCAFVLFVLAHWPASADPAAAVVRLGTTASGF